MRLAALFVAVMAVAAFSSCINDEISSSASDQPTFSTDTVRLGTLFTLGPSPTHKFLVHNRNDKGIIISRIAFADDPTGAFRLNVDGISGKEFSNVEIRENDSIYVCVEATLPENGRNMAVDVIAHIEFLTNGVTSRLPVKASGRDVEHFRGNTRITADTRLSDLKPIQVYDSIVVEKGATLTVPPGMEIFFHDDARLVVHGSLRVEGTAEKPVALTGDRFGYVAAKIPYEIMSGQWRGVEFSETSRDNYISHASIRNTMEGIVLDHTFYTPESPALRIVNSQVRNSKNYTLLAIHTGVEAAGCEFTDASYGIVGLIGGAHSFSHCTFANYYLFTAIGGPAVQLAHLDADHTSEEGDEAALPYLSATFTNSIIYGNGGDISHGDLDFSQVYLYRCLLKSNGTDDDHFVDCLWGKDPQYYTRREDYHFDYRLKPTSPAAAAGLPEYTSPLTPADRFGTPRSATTPTLGAYQLPD